jgi:hypothetical protein
MIKYEIRIINSTDVIAKDQDEALSLAYQIFDEHGLMQPTSEMEIVSSESTIQEG